MFPFSGASGTLAPAPPLLDRGAGAFPFGGRGPEGLNAKVSGCRLSRRTLLVFPNQRGPRLPLHVVSRTNPRTTAQASRALGYPNGSGQHELCIV
jgi:hypothetical protein